jgi:hypothetical protein
MASTYTFSNIFVADEKNNEVIILNSNGDEVVRFSKLLKKKGYLNIVAPSQIVIDRTGTADITQRNFLCGRIGNVVVFRFVWVHKFKAAIFVQDQ